MQTSHMMEAVQVLLSGQKKAVQFTQKGIRTCLQKKKMKGSCDKMLIAIDLVI